MLLVCWADDIINLIENIHCFSVMRSLVVPGCDVLCRVFECTVADEKLVDAAEVYELLTCIVSSSATVFAHAGLLVAWYLPNLR